MSRESMVRGGRTRIVFVTNSCFTLFHFRRALMLELRRRGLDVHAAAPRDEYATNLERLGIPVHHVPFNLGATGPAGGAQSILGLCRLYRRLRPHAAHHFSLKPIVFGTLAARIAGVPRIINTVTGLGHAFSRTGPLQSLVLGLLRLAAASGAYFTYQNESDLLRIEGKGKRQPPPLVIPGSGVDTEQYAPDPRRPSSGAPVTFLMFGRMLWSKGVVEYCRAAAMILARRRGTDTARFILLGGILPGNPTNVAAEWTANPDTIPPAELAELVDQTGVEHRPHDDDVRRHILEADVVVLPTFYPEGVPRSLLEAMSCARAIVTTDTPGCRDLVEPERNGLLVPARDAQALAAAMERLIDGRERLEGMGRRSREIVLERYSDERILERALALYGETDLLG